MGSPNAVTDTLIMCILL